MKLKKLLGITLAVVLTLLTFTASACTGIYVGPEASADGTILMGRSNDHQGIWGNYAEIVERVENVPGRTMAVDNGGTVFMPLPDTTYRYTATPWLDSTVAAIGMARDAAACANEYGVSMTMAVTAFANKDALAADPLVPNGITECTANELVICQSATAREAVNVLARLMDTYGSSECNIAMIADQNEAWYVEMYTGHQYAAVKLPADAVAVYGNEYNLTKLSDYEECIASPALFTLPAENGFAVYDEDGEMNLMKTYSLPFFEYSHMRTWIGHKLLGSGYGDYDAETVYPLTFKPENKVSLTDVMNLLRNRYEGTPYCPDTTGRTDMRVIGTDTAMSVHVLETYPDLPADMAVVTWLSTAPAAFGCFVPVSVCEDAIDPAYGSNQSAEEYGNFDFEHYAYYAMKAINTLVLTDEATYGPAVQNYWQSAEKGMARGMSEVLHEAAAKRAEGADARSYITNYCARMQKSVFEDAKYILNRLMFMMAENSNTMRRGTDPETHEVLRDDKPKSPMVIDLDPSVYEWIPAFVR